MGWWKRTVVIFREGLLFGGAHHTQIPHKPTAKPIALKWKTKNKTKTKPSESALMFQNQKNQQQMRKVMSEAHVGSCCILHIRFTAVEWSGHRKIVNQASSHCAFAFGYQTWKLMATTLSFFNYCYSEVSGGSGACFPLGFEKIWICLQNLLFSFFFFFFIFFYFFFNFILFLNFT